MRSYRGEEGTFKNYVVFFKREVTKNIKQGSIKSLKHSWEKKRNVSVRGLTLLFNI